jgi:hypothetical protein
MFSHLFGEYSRLQSAQTANMCNQEYFISYFEKNRMGSKF